MCRISNPGADLADIAVEHIKNRLVMLDYIHEWRQLEQQQPAVTHLPLPVTFYSYVFAQPAWPPIPAYHDNDNNAAETQYIHMAEQAAAQGRQVVELVRGIPGHSVFPNAYRPLSERVPNLHPRVAFALRPNFLTYMNCALPQIQAGTPFTHDLEVKSHMLELLSESSFGAQLWL